MVRMPLAADAGDRDGMSAVFPIDIEQGMDRVPTDFMVIQRETGNVLKHRSADVWIVFYESSNAIVRGVWRVYRAVQRVPVGRDPWAVDNRCVSPRDGVVMLSDAIDIARKAATT
jgi:hypothetical protein